MEVMTSAEYRKLPCKKKRQKYNNRKVEYRGEVFDSQKELNRWLELKILERFGEVKDIRRQVVFELVPKSPGQRAVKYIADFVYSGKISIEQFEEPIYIKFVEDCKGYKTPMYRLKKKLMKAKFGIDIRES